MYPNYNYYPAYPQRQQQQYLLKGQPVSSIDEVKAIPVDFDGSIFYFPDVAEKKIYTKQIGMDGSAILNVYEMRPLVQQSPNFITREEFDIAMNQLKDFLNKQIPTQNVTKQEQEKVKVDPVPQTPPQYNF